MLKPIAVVMCLSVCGAATAEAPRSDISWLTESLTRETVPDTLPRFGSGPVSDAVVPFPESQIETSDLNRTIYDGIGTVPPDSLSLPDAIWGNVSALRARRIVQSVALSGPPAMRSFARDLMLTRTEPPPGAGPSNALLLARIDRLMDAGMLAEAEALLQRGDAGDPDLFRRLFDIGLLTGRADQVCERLRTSPTLSPSLKARVFCLARTGDWEAAALTLRLGQDLGSLSDRDVELLERFLDPQLFEGQPFEDLRGQLTTLDFFLIEAAGASVPAARLPLAFNHLDIAESEPLRARTLALEKLVRGQAVGPEALFAAFRAAKPAASGGVWDHMAAVQDLDRAFAIGAPEGVGPALVTADRIFADLGLRFALAQEYARQLAALDPASLPDNRSRRRAGHLLILAGEGAAARSFLDLNPDGYDDLLMALAERAETLPDCVSPSPLKVAIMNGFSDLPTEDETARRLLDRIAAGNLAPALFEIERLLAPGAEVDPGDLEAALRGLRAAGQDDLARRVALETILLLPEA